MTDDAADWGPDEGALLLGTLWGRQQFKLPVYEADAGWEEPLDQQEDGGEEEAEEGQG